MNIHSFSYPTLFIFLFFIFYFLVTSVSKNSSSGLFTQTTSHQNVSNLALIKNDEEDTTSKLAETFSIGIENPYDSIKSGGT